MVRQAESGWQDGWYVVPYHVQFRDLDPYGHVNNAVFFTYFEWARTLLWFEMTGGRGALDIGFIVARAECDFRAQLVLEPIRIRVRVSEMRNTSFDFVCEIRKENDGALAATGKVVVVLFDWQNQSKIPIPEELKRRVTSLQKGEG